MSRPDTQDFEQLFLSDTPMIDTRAPIEFKKGAFPHTVNLPLMSDQERAKVGTCYKKKGQDEAIKLGHQLVSGDLKEARVQAWLDFTRQHPEGYLYCFRGGLRSQICQQWLKDAGCDYPRITGGYKAMRRYLIDTLDELRHQHQFMILAGETGAAKTELLPGFKASLDLEGLANHRGSAFGKRASAQPSQIGFENALSIALLRQHKKTPGQTIVLEDESLLIGRCAIPEGFRETMNQAPVVLLEVSLEDRTEHSFKNYILHKLQEWQHTLGEADGFDAFEKDLQQSLANIQRRLGGARYQELKDLMDKALAAHRAGDNQLHRDWIYLLLKDYYDPLYHYQLDKKRARIVFSGNADEVTQYLNSH